MMDYISERKEPSPACWDHPNALEIPELFARWKQCQVELETWQMRLTAIRAAIMQRMEASGATELPCAPFLATITRRASYALEALTPLLELLPEEELTAAGAYTPAHQQTITVTATWNVTKLKPFSKRGAAIQAVIEAARIEGGPQLRIQERTAASDTAGHDG